MTVAMTTERLMIALFAVLLVVFAGCDDIQPTETDFTAGEPAIEAFGKTAAEKDAFCSANPNFSKCARWCANPSSNCDGDPPPPPSDDPVANFSYSANELTVQFTNTSQNDDASSWDFGDGTGSSADSPSHTYSDEGTYLVTLTVTNEDGSDSASQSVTVTEDDDPPPPPPPGDSEMLDVDGQWPIDRAPSLSGNDTVCFIGYSNSGQIAGTFVNGGYGNFTGATFFNAGVGGRALERWAGSEGIGLLNACPSGTTVIMSQVSSQENVVTAQQIADQIAQYLPLLQANIRQVFPNAKVYHYQGEPAHWVSADKRESIREPARYLHGLPILNVVTQMQQADPNVDIGPYLWTSIGEANLSGEEWTPADYADGGTNQHPSTAGREKASRIYAWWFSLNN